MVWRRHNFQMVVQGAVDQLACHMRFSVVIFGVCVLQLQCHMGECEVAEW